MTAKKQSGRKTGISSLPPSLQRNARALQQVTAQNAAQNAKTRKSARKG